MIPRLLEFFLLFSLGLNLSLSQTNNMQTVYEYFATEEGQNTTGLVAEKYGFKLNGRPLRIISGSMHYFRIHPSLWRDRLRKLRASGANTVETYVPWNLHEPQKDVWDFGQEVDAHDMSMFMNIRKFIQMAKEEDLLLLLRPGPFICAEFEFGGLPSYLLRDPDMKVRTAYQPYLDRVKVYLDNILKRVVDLQFTSGGPIIALQIENEYGTFDTRDLSYLEFIRDVYLSNGINSLLFTSDGSYNGLRGTLPDPEILKTANFQIKPESNLNDLLKFQPDKPVMVMEYWSGWFDHVFEPHSVRKPEDMEKVINVILGPLYNGSINFYMFHGGTNFGFLSGANNQSSSYAPFYAPDVTSYDYDAPITENGDYTPKYHIISKLSEKYGIPQLGRPPMLKPSKKMAYPSIPLQKYLKFSDILPLVPKFNLETRISMENLDLNQGSGQSQGYILYRKRIPFRNGTIFKAGPVKDFGILMVDEEIVPFPKKSTNYWINSVQEYILPEGQILDLLIENMGRVNFGGAKDFLQWKGIWGHGDEFYHLDQQEIKDIEVFPLEFKGNWIKSLTNWRLIPEGKLNLKAPLLIQSSFEVAEVGDTFLDMSSWSKGIVFINGFNLGRYFNVGPQQTLYLPAPFLKIGSNTITIFEQFKPGSKILFSSVPNLGPVAYK